MDKAHTLALYDDDQRRRIEYPDLRREETAEVVRHIELAEPGEGVVLYSQLTAANADAVILEQVQYFARLKQDFEWKVYDHDQPPDLRERLRAHGFAIEEAEALMVLDLVETPNLLQPPISHTIRRITQPEKLADLATVKEKVWGESATGLMQFLGNALTHYPDQMSIYVAYVDEQPASAAWIFFPRHSQFASLWGGSTVSEFRKRGLYTALLAARAQEAHARQVRYLTVDASPMSRPILEKLGFEWLTNTYPCKWTHTR